MQAVLSRNSSEEFLWTSTVAFFLVNSPVWIQLKQINWHFEWTGVETQLLEEARTSRRNGRLTGRQAGGRRTMSDRERWGKVPRMKDLGKEGHSHGLGSHYGPGVTRPLPGRTVGALDGQECESREHNRGNWWKRRTGAECIDSPHRAGGNDGEEDHCDPRRHLCHHMSHHHRQQGGRGGQLIGRRRRRRWVSLAWQQEAECVRISKERPGVCVGNPAGNLYTDREGEGRWGAEWDTRYFEMCQKCVKTDCIFLQHKNSSTSTRQVLSQDVTPDRRTPIVVEHRFEKDLCRW